MCLTAIENEHENRINHALYGEREPLNECCVCWSVHPDNYKEWRIPHPCAEIMWESEVWCCSDSCDAKWCDTHFDEIQEYEEFQEEEA